MEIAHNTPNQSLWFFAIFLFQSFPISIFNYQAYKKWKTLYASIENNLTNFYPDVTCRFSGPKASYLIKFKTLEIGQYISMNSENGKTIVEFKTTGNEHTNSLIINQEIA